MGHKRNQSYHLGNLGFIHEHLWEYDHAITHYQKALTIAKELESQRVSEHTLGKLGNVMQKCGLVAESIEHMMQALSNFARDIGDTQSEGVHLTNLGNFIQQ